MHCFFIENGLFPLSLQEAIPTDKNLIVVGSSSDFADNDHIPEGIPEPPPPANSRMCKAEAFSESLCGCFSLPQRHEEGVQIRFSFRMKKNSIIFLDDSNTVMMCMENILKTHAKAIASPGRLFYEFLERLIARDLSYLETLEDHMEKIENAVLNGQLENISHRLHSYQKQALSFYRYYAQLTDMGQELLENENGFFTKGESVMLKHFTERVARLHSEALMLREYAGQIQDSYRAQVDIKQNKIMKTLTVVTTIFLPLSLIAGWYGMNFSNMPELHWAGGYPMVILLSLLIVTGCVILFKKKKFL